MDYKVFRKAVLAIASALILVLVIVYATNADKINAIFGRGGASDSGASASTFSSGVISAFGEQIGDNTQGFLYDDSFFDENEEIPSAVVIKKSESGNDESSADGSSEETVKDKNDKDDKSGEAVFGELENPEELEDIYNEYIEPAAIVGSY